MKFRKTRKTSSFLHFFCILFAFCLRFFCVFFAFFLCFFGVFFAFFCVFLVLLLVCFFSPSGLRGVLGVFLELGGGSRTEGHANLKF